jgi:hypothetical protein
MSTRLRSEFFTETGEQIVIPTAGEFKDGLIHFAVRTVKTLDKQNAAWQTNPAGPLGQALTVIYEMTQPLTQVGVTVNPGATKEGLMLGRVANRTHLLLEYSAALEQSTTVFPGLDNT